MSARPELPAGWVHATVAEVTAAPAVYGILQPGPDQPDGILYVRPTEIQNDAIKVADRRRTSKRIAEKYHRSSLAPDDVVLSIVGTIGKVAVVPPELEGANITQSSARIRFPREFILPRFGAYALRSPLLVSQFNVARLGTAVPRLNLAHVRELALPVAPLAEQHLIVSAIESYFTRLDDAVATLERVQRNLKRYRASVLKAAVEGRLVPTEAELARAEGRSYEPPSVLLTRILAERRRRWEEAELAKMKVKGKAPKDDKWKAKYMEPVAPDASELPALPEGWCWASVDQLGDVSGGLTQNAKREVLPLQLPFLRVANVYANELRLDEIKTIGVSEAEVGRVRLAPGDLLVVEGNGSIEQIGRVALWDGTLDPCLHQNHLIKVRFTPVALATWSVCWLLAPAGRVAIERAASSTSCLHTLSLSKVQRLPVPLAPLPEQARITSEVDRLVTIALAAEDEVATNTQRCARLRQSILKWAFEGRLVDQDPTDEPVSFLLERIRAERASATDTPPRRARRANARASNS